MKNFRNNKGENDMEMTFFALKKKDIEKTIHLRKG